MNKYAYIAAITNDLFIPCLIRSAQITKTKGRKYPFVVLVTKDVTKEGIGLLKSYDIICKEIPYFIINPSHYFPLDYKYYYNVGVNYAALSLTEYDKVFVFEADVLLLDSYDETIEKAEFKKNQYFICDSVEDYEPNFYSTQKIYTSCETGAFLCRPNLKIYKIFLQLCVQGKISDDHSAIRIFFYNSFSDVEIIDRDKYIHFAGRPKVWEIFKDFKVFQNIFYAWNISTVIKFFRSRENNNNMHNFVNNYLQVFNKAGDFIYDLDR